MITEIFSLLSSLDITKNNKLDKKFDFNLSRNRIRSISAYSSNSIFYFPTIVIDQATPDEIAMVSRMLEKSYASFVITCISLMPFHRIHADDQGSIEEYLSQFHQNLGISGDGAFDVSPDGDINYGKGVNCDSCGINFTPGKISTFALRPETATTATARIE